MLEIITLGIVLVISITVAMLLSAFVVLKVTFSDKFLDKLCTKSMELTEKMMEGINSNY